MRLVLKTTFEAVDFEYIFEKNALDPNRRQADVRLYVYRLKQPSGKQTNGKWLAVTFIFAAPYLAVCVVAFLQSERKVGAKWEVMKESPQRVGLLVAEWSAKSTQRFSRAASSTNAISNCVIFGMRANVCLATQTYIRSDKICQHTTYYNKTWPN